jgi:hypothetical protein
MHHLHVLQRSQYALWPVPIQNSVKVNPVRILAGRRGLPSEGPLTRGIEVQRHANNQPYREWKTNSNIRACSKTYTAWSR